MSRIGPGSPASTARSASALSPASPPCRSSGRARGRPASSGVTSKRAHLAVRPARRPWSGRWWSARRGRRSRARPRRARSRAGPAPAASGSTHARANTPTSWRLTPAGFDSGPEQVEDRAGAELDPRPGDVAHGAVVARRHQEADAGLADRALDQRACRQSMLTPSAVSTSAAPDLRGERAVAVLGDRHAARRRRPAPPRSRCCRCRRRRRRCRRCRWRRRGASIGSALARMARAAPVISSTVSPRTRSAIRKPPICAGVALPDMMMSKARSASASLSGRRSRPGRSAPISVCQLGHRRRVMPPCASVEEVAAGARGRARRRCSRDGTARRGSAGSCAAGP